MKTGGAALKQRKILCQYKPRGGVERVAFSCVEEMIRKLNIELVNHKEL